MEGAPEGSLDGLAPLGPDDPAEVGPYRILGVLGAGGMGRVYLGRSAGGRTVAVKLVLAELAAEEEFRRRFAREVAAARRVGGEWTAPVLDADTGAANPWVATGYVPGPSLARVVGTDHGPLPEGPVLALAGGLARALTGIHAAGLVHRDLKPSNVLVTAEGPRVIDFGIARALDAVTGAGATGAGTLTGTGVVIGSPGFMSPEQVRGERLGPASDVFSLGAVLAYAATGRMPFGAPDIGVHSLMYRVANEEPELGGMPDAVAPLVLECLAKRAAARPSAAEVAARAPWRAGVPWLPPEVLFRLGRDAARLLALEAGAAARAEAGAEAEAGVAPRDAVPPDPAPERVRLRFPGPAPRPVGTETPPAKGRAWRRRRSRD
ncbi:serine/threonine-protein kinase [Streptomyces sp. NPDC050504]|uniref:serine/threonine-protein kinase n=1 Tax=Streptomyces sp. NPDC050504 TaxID=3365618 RepID=UPI0037944197